MSTPAPTLTDDALTQALSTAAESFPAPASVSELLAELEAEDGADPWWRRRVVQVGAAAAAVVLAIGLVQAVSPPSGGTRAELAGGSGDRASSGFAGRGSAAAGKDSAVPLGAPELVPSAGGVSGGAVPQLPGTGGSTGTSSKPGDDSARVVKTGEVSLVVDKGKVGTAVARVRGLATASGGYVAQEETSEFGQDPSATITLRVPVDRFDGLMAQLRSKGFGAKVVSSRSSGKDVTGSYTDIQAQITSLRAARDRYLAILNRAASIGQVLEVQQRIDDVQRQIDQLEGSRRLLANQSDLATLTVSVAEEESAVLRTAERTGFSKAWYDARQGFTSGVQAIIASSGRLVLVLLVGALLLVLGRVTWRFARRRLI